MRKARIYTQKDCPLCVRVIEVLHDRDCEVEIVDVAGLDASSPHDPDALAARTELAMNDGKLPVVVMEGSAFTPSPDFGEEIW